VRPPTNLSAELYEIRLVESPARSLIFATGRTTEQEALDFARRLLERHPEHSFAEVWHGMKLLRRV
jgi:hypothetical protein